MLVWLELVGRVSRLSVDHVAEHAGNWIAARRQRRRDRRVAQIVQQIRPILRRLHRDVIGDAGGGIGPEIGRDLLRGAQADIDVAGDRIGVEAELLRAGAIDGRLEGRAIDFLLEMRIGNAGDRGDAPLQLVRNLEIGCRGRRRSSAHRSAPAVRN